MILKLNLRTQDFLTQKPALKDLNAVKTLVLPPQNHCLKTLFLFLFQVRRKKIFDILIIFALCSGISVLCDTFGGHGKCPMGGLGIFPTILRARERRQNTSWLGLCILHL